VIETTPFSIAMAVNRSDLAVDGPVLAVDYSYVNDTTPFSVCANLSTKNRGFLRS
jgi:hypothetical protein